MTGPTVLVVGAGSAGARHARTIAAADPNIDVSVTDPDAARAAAVGLPTVPYREDGFDGFDGIVLASPTSLHAYQTRLALASGARVLVEKPMATTGSDADAVAAAGGDRLMVAYNLRFHAPVARVMSMVHSGRAGELMNVRLWFGSWLPDWRPKVDYRETYSARRSLGGGVLLDAIHELDLLVWLAGDDRFDVTGAVVDRIGPLEIDVEDTAWALLRHRDGYPVEVTLDYLSRRYRRGIEVVGHDATIRLDWARKVIEVETADAIDRQSAATSVAKSYELQAEHVVAFIRGDAPPVVGGHEGARSVRLAELIRAAG